MPTAFVIDAIITEQDNTIILTRLAFLDQTYYFRITEVSVLLLTLVYHTNAEKSIISKIRLS